MAIMNQTTSFKLELTVEEFRLIAKALGGRLTKPEEIAAAKKLGDEISVKKAVSVQSLARENDKLIENLKAAGLWNEE